ncbi:MAG: hypothetical protein GY696_12395 [Gammaproteobacteria bacterium]|nr:hypothetical protein [Gammaproteobacteria bacterium]
MWRKQGGMHLQDSQEGRNHVASAPRPEQLELRRSSRANKGTKAKRFDPCDQS